MNHYRVSIREKDGKFAVTVEYRAEQRAGGMPMGELDTIDQASTVAHFLQDALHQCHMAGLKDGYERAIAIIDKAIQE